MHTKVLVPKFRMTKWLVLLAFMILILFAVSPVQAAVNVITAGDVVFVGEQNLDVTQAVNSTGSSTIVWFNPGDDPSTATPAKLVTVANPLLYYIDPSIYANNVGNWYRDTERTVVVFNVQNPTLSVSTYDSAGIVPTGFNRYFGTKLNFRLDTNLVSLAGRGATSFINLYVRDQSGVTYNQLYRTNPATTQTLVGLTVASTPYYWSDQSIPDLFWNTGSHEPVNNNLRYSAGMYTIWAQTVVDNANKLYVVSNQNQVNLIQETLSITSVPSVTRSNPFTVNITGRPNTEYTIWILNNPCHRMSGDICDQPPYITPGQQNLIFDPIGEQGHHIANITVVPPQCIDHAQIWQTIPTGGVNVPNSPYQYYANVTTDANGLATVGFTTTTDTAPLTYKIHAQGIKLDGDPIYAETQITVNKGTVTLNLPSEAILGTHIPIDGTNTDSYFTYLFLTGPCQPQCGANLTNPGVPLGDATIVRINNTDRSWSYNYAEGGWDTSVLKIQPGTYTIYASSKPDTACTLGDCDAYTTAVIELKEPTIAATISPNPFIRDCCSPNVPVIITGNTTGNDAHMIEYWVFGEQKVGDVHYYHGYYPDCCGDFEINLETDLGIPVNSIPAGKYYIVLQHPMYNHVFDVLIEGDFQNDINYRSPQHPQWPPYTIIGEQNKLYVISSSPIRWSKMFPIEGADAKRELDALNALIGALNDPGIDDIYLVLNLTVKDAAAPTAAFTGTPTSGSVPLGVQFTDQSTGSPTSWSWEFGDGTTSTEQNPYHVYSSMGVYTVRLTASKTIGGHTYSDPITKVDYISVGVVPLQAAFTGSPRNGMAPLSVQFTDQSTGSPTSWFWDFGDGQYSTVQNPSHTYANAGSFAVSLTASKLGVSNSLTVPNYIVVSGVTPTPTPTPVPYDRITLNPGWNFVSTPKVLASGYNTGSIFSGVNMGGRSAWIWHGEMNPPQWVPVISTTPIQPLWGIWIYSVSNTVVNLQFDPSSYNTPPSRSLPAGWSGIGFTGTTQTSARNTYLSVQPNWTTSMGFNAITQMYEPTIFNGDPTELTVLFPTKGYWLYMRTPGNLAAIGA